MVALASRTSYTFNSWNTSISALIHKKFALLIVRIPSPFGSTFCNENAANYANSHFVYNTILLSHRKNTVCCYLEMWVNTVCTSSPAGKWSSPSTAGPRPPPCSHFTFTALSQHLAVMFGGAQPERGVVSDVYIIDFNTTVWWIHL